MCTMILKESVAYYVNNGSSVYCCFLDATKAFDRVEYCKLFRMLIKRRLSSVVLRLLCTIMYLNHSTQVEWNGFRSVAFKVLNGVKQGGILSPIMFCVYIDDMLLLLQNSDVGCYIGNYFVGALAYADDIVLLAPSANAMRRMLLYCDSYASEYNITFNASKSKCIHFCLKGYHRKIHGCTSVFFVCSQPIEVVKQWSHLGHIISYNMDDRYDIMRCRDSLLRQINNVLCFFRKLNPIIKLRLLVSIVIAYMDLCCGMFVMDMLNVCVGPGELVFVVCGVAV